MPLKDKALPKIWIAKIRRTNTPVNEHARLCSDHFEDTCFESELLKTRRIASLRIHVERAMERIKNFRILDYTASKMMENGVIDQVFFTCCMLSNVHDPLIE